MRQLGAMIYSVTLSPWLQAPTRSLPPIKTAADSAKQGRSHREIVSLLRCMTIIATFMGANAPVRQSGTTETRY